jgi:hypothetical protein
VDLGIVPKSLHFRLLTGFGRNSADHTRCLTLGVFPLTLSLPRAAALFSINSVIAADWNRRQGISRRANRSSPVMGAWSRRGSTKSGGPYTSLPNAHFTPL